MAFSATMTGTGRNCSITSGSPTITVSSATGLVVGATIQGTGITAGTKITAIAGTTVTMSANATATNATASLIFSSVYGSILTIQLTASGDVATWQNVFNAGFGLLQGSRELFFPGAMTLQFDTIAAGAVFNHQDWTVEYGTGGRQLFDSGKLAGEHRGGYLVNGTQFIKAAGPTFVFNNWNNSTPGGSGMFTNTGGALTKGGLFRMHNPRFVLRSGSNNAFAFVSTRDDLLVENMILDYQYASGSNASIGGGYGVMKNTYVIFANSGLQRPNSTSNATIDGLFYVGLYGDSPNHKFAIPNGFTLDGYAPQVLSTQLLGGFQDNTTETFSNINLSTAGWGLEDLKTKYRRYGGPNEIRFPRTVSLEFNDASSADLTGVTLYIRSGAASIVNAVQAGDYSALTQALVLNWTTSVASYRAPNTITDTINQIAQVRKYGYQEQSVAYSLNLAAYSQPFFMLADTYVASISEATAAALTTVGINWTTKTITPTADLTYDQINARMAWELAQTTGSANADPRTLSGSNLTLATGWTLVVNTGRTISAGTAITYLYAPTITLNGTGRITAVYATTAGVSTSLELRDIKPGAAYIVANNATKATYLFGTNGTASAQDYQVYFPPGSAGTAVYVARQGYGDQFDFEVITLVAGAMWYQFTDIPDEGITETNLATVQAYTTLENTSKLYDYIAAYRMTEAGIKLGNIVVRAGTQLQFGSYSGRVKSTAASVFSIASSTITLKASALDGTTRYDTIVATPPATWVGDTTEQINCEVEDANGDSSVNIQAAGISTFEVWKITDATDPDDYATGTLLDTVGIGKYRFLHADGYKMVIRDTTTNFRVVSEMEKGTYTAALFFGASVQLAQAAEVSEINNKVDAMQIDITNLPSAVWNFIVETGHSALATMRLMASVLVGKVSGAGSGVETFRDLNDTKDRVISTVDKDGNRTNVNKDAS